MLIKKPSDLQYSDVTPKAVYTNRREFLAALGIGAGLGGALLTSGVAQAGTKLEVASKSPFSTTETGELLRGRDHYNNFYEFGTEKNEPVGIRQELPHVAVDRLGRRPGRETAEVRPGFAR